MLGEARYEMNALLQTAENAGGNGGPEEGSLWRGTRDLQGRLCEGGEPGR